MLKSIATVTILSLAGIAAAAQAQIFNTIAQAEKYCPAATALTFTNTTPAGPMSVGKVTGSHNDVAFISQKDDAPASDHNVPHPKNLDTNNRITDATFRNVGTGYGHIDGSRITCWYSYESKLGAPYALIMQGSQI